MIEVSSIKNLKTLLVKSKWLEGKTLDQIAEDIRESDSEPRVRTKGYVGYVIERGFFGIKKNSQNIPDIEHLDVEIKTCPLKFDKHRRMLSVKEPLSLNIINYHYEAKNSDITESALYKKNRLMLLILYIHDKVRQRSEYIIKYVILWEMDEKVLEELGPDYDIILGKIKQGKAHEIHQSDNRYLTLCPKHSGKFRDPDCMKSKRSQPYSRHPAEVRAFRLKNRYMNMVISRALGKRLEKGWWRAD